MAVFFFSFNDNGSLLEWGSLLLDSSDFDGTWTKQTVDYGEREGSTF